jgi:hypothetical protein
MPTTTTIPPPPIRTHLQLGQATISHPVFDRFPGFWASDHRYALLYGLWAREIDRRG